MTLSNKATRGLALALMALMVCTASNQARAELEASDEKALKDTQDMLRNKSRRSKEGVTNDSAKAADANAKDVMGSAADTEALYALSADIFGSLVKEANGDPVKIQEILNRAMKNPDSFASKLTPSQLSKLKALAKSAESNRPGPAPK